MQRIKEQDKNQTGVSRTQSDSRSETGTKADCLACSSYTLYRFQGSLNTHLDNCTERENARARLSKTEEKRNSISKGVYKPFER